MPHTPAQRTRSHLFRSGRPPYLRWCPTMVLTSSWCVSRLSPDGSRWNEWCSWGGKAITSTLANIADLAELTTGRRLNCWQCHSPGAPSRHLCAAPLACGWSLSAPSCPSSRRRRCRIGEWPGKTPLSANRTDCQRVSESPLSPEHAPSPVPPRPRRPTGVMAELATYRTQLEQVEAALLADPGNEELAGLAASLKEVIALQSQLEPGKGPQTVSVW